LSDDYSLRKGQQCMHERIKAGFRLREAARLLDMPPCELSGIEHGRIAVDADRYDAINAVYRRHRCRLQDAS
jgi:hypothetical protein